MSWSVDALMVQLGIKERELGSSELWSVQELLQRNLPVFSIGNTDLGRTHLTLRQN